MKAFHSFGEGPNSLGYAALPAFGGRKPAGERLSPTSGRESRMARASARRSGRPQLDPWASQCLRCHCCSSWGAGIPRAAHSGRATHVGHRWPAAICLLARRQLGVLGTRRVPALVRELRRSQPAVFHAHLSWPLAAKYGLLASVLARVPAVSRYRPALSTVPSRPFDRPSGAPAREGRGSLHRSLERNLGAAHRGVPLAVGQDRRRPQRRPVRAGSRHGRSGAAAGEVFVLPSLYEGTSLAVLEADALAVASRRLLRDSTLRQDRTDLVGSGHPAASA
jgi:hypothetical protein